MADGDAEPIAPEEVDAQRVCKTVTVKALGNTPFWFRWQASVSTADVFDKFGTRHSYDWEYSDWNLVRNPSSRRRTQRHHRPWCLRRPSMTTPVC